MRRGVGVPVRISGRTVRWAVPTAAAVLLLVWGVSSGGIRLAAAPGPTGTPEPRPGGIVASGGPTIVPLPTDHLRPIRLVRKPPDDDAEHLHWSLLATHDHGRRLALQVTLGCGPVTGASVAEARDRVVLTVYGPPPPRYCALSLVIVFRSVRLPHPLGARTLVHG